MPIWTFPEDQAGHVVPVVVGLPAHQLAVLRQTQAPIPPFPQVRALIDTGSDVCVISPVVIQHLGLTPIVGTTTQTTLGSGGVTLYEVSLVIHGPAGPMGPHLVQPDLFVMGLATSLPQQLDVLIGRDVLRECLFIADGPARTFSLAF
jgi:hypothetical protein